MAVPEGSFSAAAEEAEGDMGVVDVSVSVGADRAQLTDRQMANTKVRPLIECILDGVEVDCVQGV